MVNDSGVDYYEVLQISANAEPETVHRVYRLLAQRFHPDNGETGDEGKFRALSEAYHVISDPERRARYDVAHQQQRQDRWRLVSTATELVNDIDRERIVRLTVLEVLCTQRRFEPNQPGIFILDLEELIGTPREHLEFTVWFLVQKKLIQRTDNSKLAITAEGVEYLEENHRAIQQKRLAAQNEQATTAL
jgi:curved DNA-binding protein CbpA